MAGWDGHGLPPVAAARVARARVGGARTSLLPVPGAVGVESVGLQAVGEVMGCVVQHIGWAGFGGCGYYYGAGRPGMSGMLGGTVTSGQGARFAGFRPYVDALYAGYDTAIGRLLTEARAIGADGVVGMRLTVAHMGEGGREFLALGTAVRAQSRSRPRELFTTELAGQDVAKLMYAGWVPVRTAVGISVAVRHDDYRTQRQASSWNRGNMEVSGYTDLVTQVRADARHAFDARVRAAGADGAILSDLAMHVWSIEPGEGHRDHVAESTVIGSALAQFHQGRRAPTESLSMLPLRRM